MRLVRRALLLVACLGPVSACEKCGEAPNKPADAGPEAAAAPPSASSSAKPEAPKDASADVVTRDAVDAAPTDAGASACKLLYGPAEQPFRGPAAIVPSPNLLQLVTNEAGRPRVHGVPITPPNVLVPPPPKPMSFAGMRWPPCEVANKYVYCQAPGGIVTRSLLASGAETKEIAKSKNGTRIAASAIGKDHAVVAWLEAHHTTEGVMLQAFAAIDDGAPFRLSDEGSGATQLRLVARGEQALAVYIDTRTAMVPIHARPIAAKGALADEVVFVGGPPERGIDFAIAQSSRGTFVLLPTARDSTEFGMAAIAVPDPPKHDVGAVWSMYPNGLDPAPIEATTNDPKGSLVARVLPRERAPGSPRIIELGRVDEKGAFTSLGGIADGRHVTDIAMANDAFGTTWILYGDSNSTWLQRRVCPAP